MAGTREGGKKAAATNKAKYGEDFYAKIGAEGGHNSTTGGFYYSKQHGLGWHIEAGRKGGTISRKPSKRLEESFEDMPVPEPQTTLLKTSLFERLFKRST